MVVLPELALTSASLSRCRPFWLLFKYPSPRAGGARPSWRHGFLALPRLLRGPRCSFRRRGRERKPCGRSFALCSGASGERRNEGDGAPQPSPVLSAIFLFFLADCDPQSLVEYWERQRNAQGFPKLPQTVLQNDIDDLFSGISPFGLLEHADPEGSRQSPAHSAGSSGGHSASSRATTAAAGAREQNATIGLRRVGRTRPASAMQAIALEGEEGDQLAFATRLLSPTRSSVEGAPPRRCTKA